MCKRLTHALVRCKARQSGQALAELPMVIVLVCVLVLLLIQPVVFLYTKTVVGQVAAELCRVVATDSDNLSGSRKTLLKAYAADKLEGLPKGSAFCLPGSLRVEANGNARSSQITVEVSLRQQPLPLLGLLVGAGLRGSVEVVGRASVRGAWCEVSGSPQDAPQVFGMKD